MKRVRLVVAAVSVAMFCFVLSLYAQKKDVGAGHVAWEYKTLLRHREFDRNVQDTLSVAYHREASNWSTCAEDDKLIECPKLPDKLAQLGDQGWELVSVTPRSSAGLNGYEGATTEDIWVFKRRK